MYFEYYWVVCVCVFVEEFKLYEEEVVEYE